MNDSDIPALEEERVLPNAIDIVGVVHEHLVSNYRDGVAPDLNLPTQWRMAKLVVSEAGPLALFRSIGGAY